MRELESNGDIFGSSQGVGKWDSEWKANRKTNKKYETFNFVFINLCREMDSNFTPEDNVQSLNWKKAIKNLDKMNNPMYKAGSSFQNQRPFGSASTKNLTRLK